MNSRILFLVFVSFVTISCNNAPKSNSKPEIVEVSSVDVQTITNDFKSGSSIFDIMLEVDTSGITMPALQSFVFVNYQSNWIFIGGQRRGFHGTTSSPSPFKRLVANDSIYIVNIATKTIKSAPVPAPYKNLFGATNQQSAVSGDNLYLCGGYTVNNATSSQFNWTSDHFFEINLPNLVAYVNSGGVNPNFNSVITLNLQDPYFQVTGGEMMIVNNYYYLIGGQNFDGIYSAGSTGNYTNAIRKFKISSSSPRVLSDTASLIDAKNLHRRDLNVVQVLAAGNDSIRAVMYGGVFTTSEYAFLNPVMISGLSSGQPQIVVDTMQQKANQYNCATICMGYKSSLVAINITSMLGGISGSFYNADSGKIVIGNYSDALPFSNIITSILSDGASFNLEAVQSPPGSILPSFVGSNAIFIPEESLLLNGYEDILDLEKIMETGTSPILLGYMAGGIISDGPTSGPTVNGQVFTYANNKLYYVYLNLD